PNAGFHSTVWRLRRDLGVPGPLWRPQHSEISRRPWARSRTRNRETGAAERLEFGPALYHRFGDAEPDATPALVVVDLVGRADEAHAGTGDQGLRGAIVEAAQRLVQRHELAGLP